MPSIRSVGARTFYTLTRASMLKRLHELNSLQWLDGEQHSALQQKRLLDLLEYANTYVPYYSDLFKKIGFQPADFAANPASFLEIPFLTKDIVRENHDRLITTESERRKRMVRAKTGGTTGEPMWFMRDANYRHYAAAHVYHQMEWSGWRLGQPQGWLWGHALAGSSASHPSAIRKFKDWAIDRFESNAFDITPESMGKFAADLERWPNSIVWSYVSTMYRFAQYVLDQGRQIKLQAAYTAAEPLYEDHREFIQDAFNCPVFNSYSSLEIGYIACECERHDGLHIMTRNCYTEILADGRPVLGGEEGEIILTNLTNYGFPFIRYQIEDGGALGTQPCPCGRGMPKLSVVEGRIIDFFLTRTKGRVWGAFAVPMVPTLGKIKQYQIVQKNLDLIVFRVIKDGPIDETKFADIKRACRIALGENVEAELEYVNHLPTSPTGKHRYVISELG